MSWGKVCRLLKGNRDMARLNGVIRHPHYRKSGSTDGESYNLSNSGCKVATLHLGYSSLCLECPFPECVLDKVRKPGSKAGTI